MFVPKEISSYCFKQNNNLFLLVLRCVGKVYTPKFKKFFIHKPSVDGFFMSINQFYL